MKRKLLLIAAILSMGSFAAYGTLAYFTTSENAKNVITAGTVKIQLHEENADGTPFPEEAIRGVMPSQVVDKIVYAENTGESEAWVRIKVDKSLIKDASPSEADRDGADSFISLDFNDTDWEEKDGWYYYQSRLQPGERTEDLFTQVEFAGEMGNEYKNSTVYIDVVLQAVQCANNGETVLEAAGWPEE